MIGLFDLIDFNNSLTYSSLLLPSNRATAIVGLLAAGCDLAYCLTFPISPILQAILMSFGGAF
jgi:hypothetical protein